MILPSSQKSSVIEPSQPKMAAVGVLTVVKFQWSYMQSRLMCSQLGVVEDKYQPKQGGFIFGEIPMPK